MTIEINDVSTAGLVGRKFDRHHANCFTLLRDFFALNGIVSMQRWANPTNWWERGISLYTQLLPLEGFGVHMGPPPTWQPGDVVLMAIKSPKGVPNHAGVLLPNGNMLHHLEPRLSTIEPYRMLYRDTTCAIYRHSKFTGQNPEMRWAPRQSSPTAILEMLPMDFDPKSLLPLYGPGAERCGFIGADGSIIECKNICTKPDDGFEMTGEDIMLHADAAQATWHTHPEASSNLSVGDMYSYLNFPGNCALHHRERRYRYLRCAAGCGDRSREYVACPCVAKSTFTAFSPIH